MRSGLWAPGGNVRSVSNILFNAKLREVAKISADRMLDEIV